MMHSGELTLLYVEDDEITRDIGLIWLTPCFKEVIVAADGAEALELFRACDPDIVLTDQMLPGLTGLEMVREIRASDRKTPVVLMTSSIDNEVLIEAINLGVERFLPKPFDGPLLLRALDGIGKRIVDERMLEEHRVREMALLRYRDDYNSLQQESARRKERHVLRHDLRNHAIPAGAVRWGIEVAFSPRDILCGDGYSVRRLFDGRHLIFVVDAMGSGISASQSALLAASFFNYQVEHLHLWKNPTFERFLDRFRGFLVEMLLEEEILSCGFFLLDLCGEEVEFAMFGLPPLLLRGLDGSVTRVRGNNPPLGLYTGAVKTSRLSLSSLADLLIMTDGITDAELAEGGAYRERLEEDFAASPTLASLQRLFKRHTLAEDQDDQTLVHLRRLDLPSDKVWRREAELSIAGLGEAISALLEDLGKELGEEGARDTLEVVLTEAIMNAFEHGCLGTDRAEKSRLILCGNYETFLAEQVPPEDARIELSATLWRKARLPLLLLEVRDSGPGIPYEALNQVESDSVNGRGMRMIRRLSDAVYLQERFGSLLILKTLNGGKNDAP